MTTFASRRRRLLAQAACDGVLVTNPVDVRYLTGLASSNAALVVTAKQSVLCTDSRYEEAAKSLHDDLHIVIARDVVPNVVVFLPTGVFVAFDSARTSVQAESQLREWPIWWEPRPNITASLRSVKDESEIAVLGRACEITAAAMLDTLEQVHPGMTERNIAGVFEASIRNLGSDGPAFPTIVASGPNAARPHHQPGDREVQVGDVLLIDAGAQLDGYHADMTRCAVLGRAQDWQRECHAQVLAAQEIGIELMRPGAGDVDAQVREYIFAESGTQMPHGTGHGVGLEIHEAPIMTATSAYTIPEAAVMTVEPGIYLPGRGGIRIEDTGVVRTSGYEVLTNATKDLLEIG